MQGDDAQGDHATGGPGAPPAPSAWVHLPPAEVVLSAVTAAVPEIPLAPLREFLVPEHDAAGRIVDWALDTAALRAGRSAQPYWVWRRTWERRWSLGHVDNLVDLGRIAMSVQHGVPGVLHVVLELLEAHHRGAEESVAPVELDVDTLRTLGIELADCRDAIALVGGSGRAIVDDTPRDPQRVGFARTWSPPPQSRRLVGDDVTQVSVEPDGSLTLTTRSGTGRSGTGGAGDVRRLRDVAVVDLGGERVVVTGRSGDSFRLDDDAGAPLAWIVPGSTRWRVREIPLVVVWSACFAAVPEALEVAERTGRPVRLARVAPLV
jgi:hypothetical protein